MTGPVSKPGLCFALVAAIAAFQLSCQNGDPLEVKSLGVHARFVPDAPAGAGVTLRESGPRRSHVFVEVAVEGVSTPISALALKIRYPDGISRFIGCSDGDLFPAPGTCFAGEGAPGELFVARTVITPDPPQASVTPHVIVRLEFQVFGETSGPVSIEGQNLSGSDGSALLDAQGNPIPVPWTGGTLLGRSE